MINFSKAQRFLLNMIGKLFSKYSFLSSLYYVFLDRSFFNEHRAVLSGRFKFKNQIQTHGHSSYQLRRNIHRIEKGLIAKKRKDVFASGYILQTVELFSLNAAHLDSGIPDIEELRWAFNVLSKYFSLVEDDETIAKARKIFDGVKFSELSQPNYIPYIHNAISVSSIDYDNFLKLSIQRRSVRWYQQRKVPRDLIDKAIVVAGMAPSACNRQPFYYKIYDDPIEASKIGGIPLGTYGFNENFPCLAVLIGDLSAYPDERDRHVIYIDGSLSAMAFMYALETLGVSSCAINWPDIPDKEKTMAKELKLQRFERVIMLISLGYADSEGMVPFSAKKELRHLRRY